MFAGLRLKMILILFLLFRFDFPLAIVCVIMAQKLNGTHSEWIEVKEKQNERRKKKSKVMIFVVCTWNVSRPIKMHVYEVWSMYMTSLVFVVQTSRYVCMVTCFCSTWKWPRCDRIVVCRVSLFEVNRFFPSLHWNAHTPSEIFENMYIFDWRAKLEFCFWLNVIAMRNSEKIDVLPNRRDCKMCQIQMMSWRWWQPRVKLYLN